MNRYRTVPGLGPSASKATTTTTCQKCLQKGHYSYECKASVQSRPYTSRPSRSQQLQNPKLKPALAEQMMEEPKPILPEKANESPEPQDIKSGRVPNTFKEADENFVSKKRRRSVSSASSSSVATISTNASDSEIKVARAANSKTTGRATRSRSSSASQSRSSPRSLDRRDSRRQEGDPDRVGSKSHGRAQLREDNDSSDSGGFSRSSTVRHNSGRSRRARAQEGSHGRDRPGKHRRSRSADVLPNARQQDGSSKPTRQRSLSPYSRRLALTQAMNAGG